MSDSQTIPTIPTITVDEESPNGWVVPPAPAIAEYVYSPNHRFSNPATPIFIHEPSSAPPTLISTSIMTILATTALPTHHRFNKWRRLFSLQRDGSSFLTAINNVKKEKSTILVVETTQSELFGCFTSEIWKQQHGSVKFFGNGECFIFRINDDEAATATDEEVSIYKWTGKNTLFQLCNVEESKLAIGGGGFDGEFAFCLEEDFARGTSGPTETFDNPCLCASGSNFDVLNVELYGFVPEYESTL